MNYKKKIIFLSLFPLALSASTFTDTLDSLDSNVCINSDCKTTYTSSELSSNIDSITKVEIINSANLTNSDIEGIQDATGLKDLTIKNNLITTLDLSNQLDLESLNLSSNALDSIILPDTDSLTFIDISNNQLTTFDVSNNPYLETFFAQNNKITDLSSFQAISSVKNLNLSENPITNIEPLLNLGELTSLDFPTPEVKIVDQVKFDGRVPIASPFCESDIVKNNDDTYFRYCKVNGFAYILSLADTLPSSTIWVDINNDGIKDSNEINNDYNIKDYEDNKDLVKEVSLVNRVYKNNEGIDLSSYLTYGYCSNYLEGINEYTNIEKLTIPTIPYTTNSTYQKYCYSTDLSSLSNLKSLEVQTLEGIDRLNIKEDNIETLITYTNNRTDLENFTNIKTLVAGAGLAKYYSDFKTTNPNIENMILLSSGGYYDSLSNLDFIDGLDLKVFAYIPTSSSTKGLNKDIIVDSYIEDKNSGIDLSLLNNMSNLNFLDLSGFRNDLNLSVISDLDLDKGNFDQLSDLRFSSFSRTNTSVYDLYNDSRDRLSFSNLSDASYNSGAKSLLNGHLNEVPYRAGDNFINDKNICSALNNDSKYCGETNYFAYNLDNYNLVTWFDLNNDGIKDDGEESTDKDYQYILDNKDYLKEVRTDKSYVNDDMFLGKKSWTTINSFKNLEKLNIKTKQLLGFGEIDFTGFDKLKTISLYQVSDSSSNYIQTLNSLKNLSNLEEFNIGYGENKAEPLTTTCFETDITGHCNIYGSTFSDITSIETLPSSLKTLRLIGFKNLFATPADFSNLTNLEHLSISDSMYNYPSEKDYSYTDLLNGLSNNNNLKILELTYNPSNNDLNLTYLPDSVEHLSLSHNKFLSKITDLKESSKLNSLNLYYDYDINDISFLDSATNFGEVNPYSGYIFKSKNISDSSYYEVKSITDGNFCSAINNDTNYCALPIMTTDNVAVNFIVDNHIEVYIDDIGYTKNASVRDLLEDPTKVKKILFPDYYKDYYIFNSDMIKDLSVFTNLTELSVYVKPVEDNSIIDMSNLAETLETIRLVYSDITNEKALQRITITNSDHLINVTKLYLNNPGTIDLDSGFPSATYMYLRPTSSVLKEYFEKSSIAPKINLDKFPKLTKIEYIRSIAGITGSSSELYYLSTDSLKEGEAILDFSKLDNLSNLKELYLNEKFIQSDADKFNNWIPNNTLRKLKVSEYADTSIVFKVNNLKDLNPDTYGYLKIGSRYITEKEYKAPSDSNLCKSDYVNRYDSRKLYYCVQPDYLEVGTFLRGALDKRVYTWVDYNNDDIKDSSEVFILDKIDEANSLHENADLVKGFYTQYTSNVFDGSLHLFNNDEGSYDKTTLYSLKDSFKNLKEAALIVKTTFNDEQINYLDFSKILPDSVKKVEVAYLDYKYVTMISDFSKTNIDTFYLYGNTRTKSLKGSYLFSGINLKTLLAGNLPTGYNGCYTNISFEDMFPDLNKVPSLENLRLTSPIYVSDFKNIRGLTNLQEVEIHSKNDYKQTINFDALENTNKIKSFIFYGGTNYGYFNFDGLKNNTDMEYIKIYLSKGTYNLNFAENFTKLGENNYTEFHSDIENPREGFSFYNGYYVNIYPIADSTPFCQSVALLDEKVNGSNYEDYCKSGYKYILKSLNNASMTTLTSNGKTYQTYLNNGDSDILLLDAEVNLEDYYEIAGSTDLKTDLEPYIYIDSSDGITAVSIDSIEWGDNKNQLKIKVTKLENKIETLKIMFKDSTTINQGNLVFTEAKVLEDLYSNLELQGYISEDNRFSVLPETKFTVTFFEKVGFVNPISLFPYVYYGKFNISTSDSCLEPLLDSHGKYLLNGINGVVFKSTCENPVKVTATISNMDSSDNISSNDYKTEFYVGPALGETGLIGETKVYPDKNGDAIEEYYLSDPTRKLTNDLINLEYDSSLINVSYNIDSFEENKFFIQFHLLDNSEATVVKLKVTDPETSNIYEKWIYVYPYNEISSTIIVNDDSSFLLVSTIDNNIKNLITEFKKNNIPAYDTNSIVETFNIIKESNPEYKTKSYSEIFKDLKQKDLIEKELTPLLKERIIESNEGIEKDTSSTSSEDYDKILEDKYGVF